MKKRKFKRKQKKQLAFLTFVVLIASLAAVILLTPGFNIKEINVYGNAVLEESEIKRASGLVTGINIFGVSMKEAEDNIMSMGYIDSVKVKRRLPSKIDITVVEEVGVAYIKAEQGYVIITADGRCIDITDGINESEASIEAPSLPLVTGLKDVRYRVGSTLKSENEEQLQALFVCLKEFSKQDYVFNMREIDMSDTERIQFYYRGKNLCVSIGNIKNIDYKMQSFGSILKELGPNPAGHIDLRYEYGIYSPPRQEKNEEKNEDE